MIGLRTLVLNSNYMPISLFPLHALPVEDAVTRVFNKTCYAVFNYDRPILTPSLDMKWPSVIARTKKTRIKGTVKLRKESLFYRDHGICVYCENPVTINTLTYDHVLPKVRGGWHGWDNIVSSCASCNSKKGSHKPEGTWKPKFQPFVPNYFQLLSNRKKFPINVPDESWIHFLDGWKAEITIT